MTSAARSEVRESPRYPEIDAFESGAVDPERFDHAAHVFVAWRLLGEAELPVATRRFSSALRRLTRQWGVGDTYHETISVFFMTLIAERSAARPDARWPEFEACNPDLFGQPGKLLVSHYSPGRLQSALARRQFLLPDRSPEPGG